MREIRFYVDPETGLPHIYDHEVAEEEVEDVLADPGDDFPARNNSRIALGTTASGRQETPMKQAPFPPGWDEERVRDVIDHYESQTEDEALAEHEAACGRADEPMIAVPAVLLPKVREMIARYRAEAEASSA